MPAMPSSIIRLTALLPPPPTPTTLIRAKDSIFGDDCMASSSFSLPGCMICAPALRRDIILATIS